MRVPALSSSVLLLSALACAASVARADTTLTPTEPAAAEVITTSLALAKMGKAQAALPEPAVEPTARCVRAGGRWIGSSRNRSFGGVGVWVWIDLGDVCDSSTA
jgi:hypothetical protein